MKKIKVICNLRAGRQLVQRRIPDLVQSLQEKTKTNIDLNYTTLELGAKELAIKSCEEGYDLIIAVGGDGTVNEVLNGIMQFENKPSLAIYPTGTVNDFGTYLKIPREIEDFTDMIVNNNSKKIDVGVAGDKYFLNVAAAGLLPDVAHKVSTESKTVLGKFAYYLEGIKEFSKSMFKPITIKYKIDEEEKEKEILFFLIANSPTVGGFKYIAPDAKIDDGYLDLLIVEHNQLRDVATIFFKSLRGNHGDHPGLRYLQIKEFFVESNEDMDLDLDGELGGKLPVKFYVKKQVVNIILP